MAALPQLLVSWGTAGGGGAGRLNGGRLGWVCPPASASPQHGELGDGWSPEAWSSRPTAKGNRTPTAGGPLATSGALPAVACGGTSRLEHLNMQRRNPTLSLKNAARLRCRARRDIFWRTYDFLTVGRPLVLKLSLPFPRTVAYFDIFELLRAAAKSMSTKLG